MHFRVNKVVTVKRNHLIIRNNQVNQDMNPQKGVAGTHSFKLIHIYIAPMVKYWRSEVGSVDRLQKSTLGLVDGL